MTLDKDKVPNIANVFENTLDLGDLNIEFADAMQF
jgi:hypothetical protein